MKKIFVILAAMLMSAGLLSAQDLGEATETYNQGATALMSNKKAEALDCFKSALTIAEACGVEGKDLVTKCKEAIPGLLLSIAKELFNEKNFDGALSNLNDAITTATAYGNADILKEATELLPTINSMKFFELANKAKKAKKYTEAISSYKKSLEADPKNSGAALYLGQLLGATGDLAGAESALKIAAENGQEKQAKQIMSTTFMKSAVKALKTKKLADAYKYANMANEYKENATAYLIAGQAAQKLKKNLDAIKNFERYVEMKPKAKNAAAIIFTIAALYQQEGNKIKALANYKKVLSNPQFSAAAKQQIAALSK